MKREIRDYILSHVSSHPNDIATVTASEFNVSRQTIVNYLTRLATEGLITATGKTRARKYSLRDFVDETKHLVIIPDLEEDVIWREKMLPVMNNLNPNVVDICQYGFTEMIRNVFDHAESQDVIYDITRNAMRVKLRVLDKGVGIFNKIQRDFDLNDPRHALLELSKGKLTSDPQRHSGEGVFFTSRMFDTFRILSEPLYYSRESVEGSDWLIEVHESEQRGTYIVMEISPYSERTVQGVFDEYASNQDDLGFTKTHVPIQLVKYEGEQLVSRSQARRLLARFERFNEVLLDFKGVTMIGQAFADEIFRVYQSEHPAMRILWVNTEQDVENMIRRVVSNLTGATTPDATT